MTTNEDRIKNMGSTEIADFMYELIMSCGQCPVNCKVKHIGYKKCPARIKQWLESEANNE